MLINWIIKTSWLCSSTEPSKCLDLALNWTIRTSWIYSSTGPSTQGFLKWTIKISWLCSATQPSRHLDCAFELDHQNALIVHADYCSNVTIGIFVKFNNLISIYINKFLKDFVALVYWNFEVSSFWLKVLFNNNNFGIIILMNTLCFFQFFSFLYLYTWYSIIWNILEIITSW